MAKIHDSISRSRPEPTTVLRREGQEVQRLYDTLLEEIVSGVIAPGTKFSEPDLARRFGTSRGPVREAIARLEERQLVQRVPNVGARVMLYTHNDILQAYEFREAVESLAARLAATNMTDAEIDELRDIHRAEKTRDFSRSFHAQIVAGSRNQRIAHSINEDFFTLLRLWRRNFPWISHGTETSWDEHEKILYAIEHRDGEAAEMYMRRHLVRLRRDSLASLRSLQSQDGRDVTAPSATA